MSRSAEIAALRARIQARRDHKPPRATFDLEARLQPLVHAELEAQVAAAQRARARDRRDPGSFQRELELDE